MEDSRTKNSLKNIKVGMINKMLTMILSFVSRRLFIQYIGIEYLGINGLFAEILGVLSLADLGFGTAMTYSFYKPVAEKDNEKIAALLSFYKVVYNVIAAIVGILGLILVPFLKYIVNIDKDIPYLEVYYIIFLADIVVSYLYIYKSSIISASQKQYIVSKYQIYMSLLKTLLQIAVVVLTRNYMLFISISVLITLANNLLVSRKASSLYPEINKHGHQLSKAEKKSIFSNLGSVFLYKLSSTLLNSTDNTLISIICGTIFVGLYANYKTVTTNITAIVTIFFSSLTASIGNLIVTADENSRYRVFKSMQMVSFFLATVSITCMYILMDEFMVIWLGTDDYLLDHFTFIAILLNYYLATTLQPLWSFREATGLYRRTRYIMVIAAVVNLILSIILGIKLGIGGIILASFIAKITTYFWYEPKLLFEEYFSLEAIKYFVPHLTNIILLFLTIVISRFLTGWIEGVSPLTWCVKAVICLSIVGIVYFVRYFRTDEFKYIVSKLRR